MRKTLYPQRKRCRRCRRFFGFIVIDRLYCSYECAGIKPPDVDPERWPRQHAFRVQGKIKAKRAFDYPDQPETLTLLKDLKKLEVYQCQYCLRYHVGHSRAW